MAVGILDYEVREEQVARQDDKMLSVGIELRISKPPAKPEDAFRIKKQSKVQKRM